MNVENYKFGKDLKITNLKKKKKKPLESNYQMHPQSNSIFNVLFHLLMRFEHLEHHLAYNCSKTVLAEVGVLKRSTHCWGEKITLK